MDPVSDPKQTARAPSGYHVWRAPGGSLVVQLSLDVVDRMLGDILTGFGAVPRRGAEVGGILIGSIEGDTVIIDDFVLAPCEYRRGPSFLLSDSDQANFAELFETWKRAPGRPKYAVGYFRSNTREHSNVGEEDRALMRQYFPPPSNVMLMVRPYATKPSTAGFITWRDNELAGAPENEFPFRRAELEGEPQPRRPLGNRRPRPERSAVRAALPAEAPPLSTPGQQTGTQAPESAPAETAPAEEPTAPPPRRRRRTWVWIALALISVLLGGVLGFQAALMFLDRTQKAPASDPYALSLTATTAGDDVHLNWDRQSAAIRSARRGALEITDGEYPVLRRDLDMAMLRTGSVIYHPRSDHVRFHVVVFPDDRSSVAADVEWHR